MLQYLGRLLAAHPDHAPPLRYLNKAEDDPVWRHGRLVAIDPQGLVFQTRIEGTSVAECLPWGSIGAVQLAVDEEPGDGP